MYQPSVLAALALTGALAAAPALAETLEASGFTVHANAFAADSLSPEVARRIGFQRGKHRGILNVTVVKGPASSGTALVEAQIVKPADRQGAIAMREIRDGTAISYMGEFPVQDPTPLEFEIRAKPAGGSQFHTLRMTRELFAD